MTPIEFIAAAYSAVQSLTDEGDQMHRRAVVGKRLHVHLHGWDAWANQVPSYSGMTECRGGRAVTLRVDGQYMDRGERYTAPSTREAQEFANEVTRLLAQMPPPIPIDAEYAAWRAEYDARQAAKREKFNARIRAKYGDK